MTEPIQVVLRALFLAVESAWNHVFGDRLNPFYHLGAIVFWLFWIIAGSGLYLYAFFETGVADAYRSVEALSRDQWFAGGLLRSLHRYASDAMVPLMFVHLLRHFAFARLTGYRAFSWWTGVLLIVLVYASAVNGFMLPWDKLAQYVLATSLEWLEWLPGFGGALARNLLSPERLNDRFFSLLSFIHIGLPLFVLLMMWVHVQRVPKARTMPPRPIAWGLLSALVVLSFAVPVLSQGGPAALDIEVQHVHLDWLLLGGFPLLERWPPAWSWGVLLVTLGLLVMAPWLGRRMPGTRKEFQVVFRPGDHAVAARPGETLLDAGLRAGLGLPYECRNGACGLCRCAVTEGSVVSVGGGSLRAEGAEPAVVLMCCTRPTADVAVLLDVPEIPTDQGARLHRQRVAVVAMDPLNSTVMHLTLAPIDGGTPMDFRAGQYLNVILADGQRRAFSFANPPHQNARIELQVRLIPGGRFTTHVFERMKPGDVLDVEGPLGRFTLHASDRPILLVAGATGFAPIQCIVEDALHRGIRRPMHLYWGTRSAAEFYGLDRIADWQRVHPGLTAALVVSGTDDAGWTGRRGLVHEAMLADFPDLSGFEVYVCGSVAMIHAAVPEFLAHGLPVDACHTDTFHPGLHVPA